MSAGDFDLVVDPETKKAYYFFEKVHTDLVSRGPDRRLHGCHGRALAPLPAPESPFTREAPAHFERDGVHYLVTSGSTGYFPNFSEFARAPDYHGPWTVLGDAHPDDPSRTSFRCR